MNNTNDNTNDAEANVVAWGRVCCCCLYVFVRCVCYDLLMYMIYAQSTY